MTVGIYISSQDELGNCFTTACEFGRAFGGELIVFLPAVEDSLLTKSVRNRVNSSEEKINKSLRILVQPLGEEKPREKLLKESKPLQKLLLPHNQEAAEDQAKLADEAACTTVRLLCDQSNGRWDRVSVLRDGYRHGSARRAGQQIVDAMPETALRIHPYEPKYSANELILIGTPYDGQRDKEDLAEAELMRSATEHPPAVGIVLTGHSASRRMYAAFENAVQRVIPQMEREHRKQLTKDLHVFVVRDDKDKDAKTDRRALQDERFDFIAMITASAALASLGLVQDSAAVIIGAMLVAPLMSPILAGSLAIVHSHQSLFRKSWQMIAVGFLFAYAVSFLIGLVYPWVADVGITREMFSRCKPSVMDFLIGFAGGGAAAYARTRSQLSSALAGAAIAAALVPPIATSGLHLAFYLTSHLTMTNGAEAPAHPILGPMLLFGINVVSIMGAAAISLWASGVRSYTHKAADRRWQRVTVVVLFMLAISSVVVAYTVDVHERTANDRQRKVESREQAKTPAGSASSSQDGIPNDAD